MQLNNGSEVRRVAMTVEELQVLITAKTSDFKKELEKVKKDLRNADKEVKSATNNIKDSFKSVAKVLGTLAIGATIKSATSEAMRFEASVQQIERQMGDSSKAFKDWANESASAFGMGRSEAIRYGAVYSNLLSSFTSSSEQTAQYTQDLLEASAVIASSTGRTMEDTMERIRSGLLGNTEAIEDLGINVNVAMIESTEAFKKFANGKSWQQLDYQTQQTIRYFAILEQTADKYGTEIAQNTSSRQAKFTAQLKDTKLALGQAFLPIYDSILPALTDMAAALANTMRYIAAFTQALFGSNQEQQIKATEEQAAAVSSIGDAYQDAAKKARGSVSGFDEVNQLTDQSGDVEGSTSGAMAVDTGVVYGGDTANITSSMDEVSAKAQEMAQKVKDSFAGMSSFIEEHKDIILASLAGLAAGFATFFIISKWGAAIVSAFQTLYLVGLYALGGIKTAFTALGVAIGAISIPVLLVSLVVAALVAAFVYFYRTNEEFRGVVDGILKKIGDMAVWLWNDVLVPFGKWLASVFVAAWDSVKIAAQWLWQNVLVPLGNYLLWFWNTVVVPLASVLSDVLAIAFKAVADIALLLWQNVLVPLGDFLKTIFNKIIESVIEIFNYWWKDTLKPLGEFLITIFKPIIEKIIEVFMFLWQKVLKPLIDFVVTVFIKVFEGITVSIKEIIEDLKRVFTGLIDFITGVFTGNWKKAWEGVKQVFKGVFDTLWDIAKFPLNLIIEGINTLIGALNSISVDIPEWVPGDFGGQTWGINIPKIPKLARGGIVDSPTLAMIGEAGKEAVVPLENTSFVNSLASAVGSAVLSAMQISNSSGGQNTDRNGDIVISIDGTILARIINPYLNNEQQRLGTSAIIRPI